MEISFFHFWLSSISPFNRHCAPPPPRTREDRASEPQTPQMLRSRPNCRHLPLRGRQSVLLAVADALLRLRGRFPIAARAASAGWPPNAVSAERRQSESDAISAASATQPFHLPPSTFNLSTNHHLPARDVHAVLVAEAAASVDLQRVLPGGQRGLEVRLDILQVREVDHALRLDPERVREHHVLVDHNADRVEVAAELRNAPRAEVRFAAADRGSAFLACAYERPRSGY